MITVAIAVVLVAGLGGLGFAAGMGVFDGESADEGESGPWTIERPRPADAEVASGEDSGEGGEGSRILTGLRGAGFECNGVTYRGGTTMSCFQSHPYRREADAVPHTQAVDVQLADGQVAAIRARVQRDPAVNGLAVDDTPFSQADWAMTTQAPAALTTIAAAVFPADELAGVNNVIAQAQQEGGPQSVSTELGRATVLLQEESTSTLEVAGEGSVTTPNGLHFVALDELEQAASGAGLGCDTGSESMTCEGGGVSMVVRFPRPDHGGDDHLIDTLEITAPAAGGAPDQAFTAAAEAVTDVVVGKVTDAGPATSWVGGCFGWGSQQSLHGATSLRCTPTLDGNLDAPEITEFSFGIQRVTH